MSTWKHPPRNYAKKPFLEGRCFTLITIAVLGLALIAVVTHAFNGAGETIERKIELIER